MTVGAKFKSNQRGLMDGTNMTQPFTPIEKGRLEAKINYLYGTEGEDGKVRPFKVKEDGTKIYKAATAKYMEKLRKEYHILLENYDGCYEWDFDQKTLSIDGGAEGKFCITEKRTSDL